MYFVYFLQATVRAERFFARCAKELSREPSERRDLRRPIAFVDAVGGPFGGGPIKIGFSRNVARRVREAGLFIGSNVRFLGAKRVRVGRAGEAAIHRRFAHLRIPGRTLGGTEWFFPGKDLLAFIAALPAHGPLALPVAHPPKRICRECGHQLPRRHLRST